MSTTAGTLFIFEGGLARHWIEVVSLVSGVEVLEVVNDAYGYPCGRNQYGRPLNLDMWIRETNNMIVAGSTGSGKTVFLKHLILHQHFLDTNVIVLDLNGDYRELCETLGGFWLSGVSDVTECPQELLYDKLTVVDLSGLKNASKGTREAHYTKILGWCESRLTRSLAERNLLVIDSFTEFSLGSLGARTATLMSGARLFNAGVVLSVSSPTEFPIECAVTSTYIVLMCVGGKQFVPLAYKFGFFTPTDLAFLSQQKKWTALLLAGAESEQMCVDLQAEDKEFLNIKSKRRFFG